MTIYCPRPIPPDWQYLKSRCPYLEVGDNLTFFLGSPLSDEELQELIHWMNKERRRFKNQGEIVLISSGNPKTKYYIEITILEVPETAEP
jgi:hypothetical protein